MWVNSQRAGGETGVGSSPVNPLRRSLVLAEAAWAQRTVRLAPEPPGVRRGTVQPGAMPDPATGRVPASDAVPDDALHLVAIGDSLVAGCGTDHQTAGLTPRIARRLASVVDRPVNWATHARLGATMRRVRYRFLPEVAGHPDVLFISAASNDLMARRTRTEWLDDLTAVLDDAQERADHVILCSAGQLYRSRALGRALRAEVRRRTDAQTEDSKAVCAERGVDYVDVAHCELNEGFWADDRFHPSALGYEMAAGLVVDAMSWLPANVN